MEVYPVRRVGMEDADFAELSRDILKRGDTMRFKAHGSSMLPLIWDGDLLTIESLDHSGLKRGDVIFYQTVGKKCVVHRVVKINIQNDQSVIVTKGDASPGSVEKIKEDLVLGKVVKLHRNEKRINPNRNLWWFLSRHIPGFLHFIYLMVRVQRKIHPNPTKSLGNSSLHSRGE